MNLKSLGKVSQSIQLVDQYLRLSNQKVTAQQQLLGELASLRQEIRTSNSLWQKFISGVITGLGTVIGATLVVAAIVFVLSKLAGIEALRPFIEEIVRIVQRAPR